MLVRAAAPLRLSFAGGGTELSPYIDDFGGQVLNGTINLHAYATLNLNTKDYIKLVASDTGEKIEMEVVDQLPTKGPLPLHRGIYNRIIRQFCNGKGMGLTLTTSCEAPVGSGLGSSSTLTVAMIKAFDEALGLALGEYELAQLAFEVERVDLGLEGGRQDQFAAAFGGFNFIEFHKKNRVIVNPLRVKEWITSELESSLLLYYTGQSRESANIIVEQQRRIKAQDADTLNHLHQLKAYVEVMKEQLLKGKITAFAESLDQSWREKCGTAASVTNSFIDHIYEKARNVGVLGGKISGAGGGGFMMLICDPTRRMDVVRMLEAEKQGRVFFSKFSFSGAVAWRAND
jgi:D-glycero-alpha-D-manno-heptose-7-phosphate kinase